MTNITAEDLVLLREMAPLYLNASDIQMRQWQEAGALERIEFGDDKEEKQHGEVSIESRGRRA
jgi:hypothetical protein